LESIFVDTGAWFALADEDDAHHKDAASIFPSLLQSYKELVTSNLVVAESYILILKGLGHNAAVDFLDHMNGSPRIKRLHATFDIEKEAEEILKRYIDQDFSYTDAVSFSIMNKFKIKKAFTYDKHFQTMGFVMV
jgi:predicted nucleic acid-binding protein